MYKIFSTLLMAAALCGHQSANATNSATPSTEKQLIIGVSPAMDEAAGKLQAKDVLQFLTTHLQPGQHAMVFNAWALNSIGTFSVPNKAAYNSEKAKLQVNKAVVAKLLNLANPNNPALVAGVTGAVKLPQFLQFLGQNYQPLDNADIVVLGSPIYVDEQVSAFSMVNGRVPGDNHLTAPADQTPFSVVGKSKLLTGARVHLGLHNAWALNDAHAYRVRRFLTLLIEGNGAELSSFVSDRQTLWQRVDRSAGKLPHTFEAVPSNKAEEMLEMITIHPPQLQKGSAYDAPIFERAVTTAAIPASVMGTAMGVEIGLRWDCQRCDLDLHIKPSPDADPISYLNKVTNYGTYHKDFISSPANNGYETISLSKPVNLNDVMVAVNFYSGKVSEPLKAELRISVDGQTCAQDINISAIKGNNGIDRSRVFTAERSLRSHWYIHRF